MIKLVVPIVIILLFLVWIRTIVTIIKTPDLTYRAGNQIVWLLVVILIPFVGVPLYWILGAPQR